MGDFWYIVKIADLEKAGRIKFIESESYFKYEKLDHGVGRFSKTPVKVYVYQKVERDSILGSLKKTSSMTCSTVSGGSFSNKD